MIEPSSSPPPVARPALVPLTDDYLICPIINGCWQLARGHRKGEIDADATVRELLRLVDAGLTTFDCGDIYLGVEELLGAMLHKYRSITDDRALEGIQVHTKFVPDRSELRTLDKAYVEDIIDRSLARLGVERLDLVQFHWWDYSVPRYVETAMWLHELVQAGKIRHLGVTNFDVPRLRQIVNAGVPIVSHQVQYSLLDTRPENGMCDFCAERGIRLLAYGTLAGGFLTRRWVGQRAPREPLENRSLVKYRLMIDEFGGWERFEGLLAAADAVAARHGVDVANVASRMVLDHPLVTGVIVGARDARYLASTLQTLSLRLEDADRLTLHEACKERPGPRGDVYDLEREPGGPHAAIMKYDLNRE